MYIYREYALYFKTYKCKLYTNIYIEYADIEYAKNMDISTDICTLYSVHTYMDVIFSK